MRGVIVVDIPEDDERVEKVSDRKNPERDIYRYTGDLDLTEYPWGKGTYEE